MPRTLLRSQEECKQVGGDYKFNKINNLEFNLVEVPDWNASLIDISACFYEEKYHSFGLECHMLEARTGADYEAECSIICELSIKVAGLDSVGCLNAGRCRAAVKPLVAERWTLYFRR